VGRLSNERTGLSFVYAAGTRQRSLSWVRVPSDSCILISLIWDSQGHGGGIRPRLYTGKLSHSPTLPVIISRHVPHRKQSFTIACTSRALPNNGRCLQSRRSETRMCLPNRCPEMGPVYPSISRSLHGNGSTPYNSLSCSSYHQILCSLSTEKVALQPPRFVQPWMEGPIPELPSAGLVSEQGMSTWSQCHRIQIRPLHAPHFNTMEFTK
jgi:hypothetical protein